MLRRPRISVVMPSFNQGSFLGAAIESVLSQDVPDIELIIMDGGSTDESVEVLKQFDARLAHWESGPDGGQAAAINAGFARASGDVLCWLNSDDYLLPGALARVSAALDGVSSPTIYYGHSIHFREKDGAYASAAFAQADASRRLAYDHAVVQPSSFWTRSLWESTGLLDETLHFAFDWEWFIRTTEHARFLFDPVFLSGYRIHDQHKTGSGGTARRQEILAVAVRHSPREWADLYAQVLPVMSQERAMSRLRGWGLSPSRAAILSAALRGHGPRSLGDARRWQTVVSMYES